ncbi:IS630 family transposase [Bacillus canaveralius]|uniref:IS630 family transposase n=1 Tax=Bacillus canaveralius TaxID=1403243 RepID=UPI0021AE05F6|nr:IS630 family transposase [Bacillus canaveralius]
MKSIVDEIQEVESRLKTEKSRRMFERYQTIRLHLMGKSVQEIAAILKRTSKTIGTYIRSYQEHGLDGLTMKFSTGKPPRLTTEQQAQLKQAIIDFQPHECGFPAKFNWTLELIRSYILREFGKSYSIRGVSKMMERLGLSYTKPTYTLAAADEEKQKEFVETTFPEVKKIQNGEIDHILFEDESMIRDYQALQYTWFAKGKQRIIKTTGKHRGVKLLATVDYVTGEIVWQEEEQYTALEFLSFLKKVTAAYPTGNMVLILDNARIHHAKMLEPFLKEIGGRLKLIFLPPYSPQLNVVEGLWKWLKSEIINNVFYHTTAEIRKNVHAFMKNLDPMTVIDRLCIRMESSAIQENL